MKTRTLPNTHGGKLRKFLERKLNEEPEMVIYLVLTLSLGFLSFFLLVKEVVAY